MVIYAPRRTTFILAASLAAGLSACAPAGPSGTELSSPASLATEAAKVAKGMTNRYWKLIELRGQPVPASDRTPYLTLKAKDDRAVGSTGCNSFFGTYTLDEAALRISFGQIAMTEMACLDAMETEKAFTEVLEQADNYSLNGNAMTLNRARMAPLARFEAVDTP